MTRASLRVRRRRPARETRPSGAGGDQSAKDGQYDGRGIVGLPIDEFQSIIRDIAKPVIARVNGFAIGGGNVFATLCDLTIAADTAKFGQVGPKVGLVDAGWGACISRPPRWRQEGARNVVPEPAVLGAGSARDGPG